MKQSFTECPLLNTYLDIIDTKMASSSSPAASALSSQIRLPPEVFLEGVTGAGDTVVYGHATVGKLSNKRNSKQTRFLVLAQRFIAFCPTTTHPPSIKRVVPHENLEGIMYQPDSKGKLTVVIRLSKDTLEPDIVFRIREYNPGHVPTHAVDLLRNIQAVARYYSNIPRQIQLEEVHQNVEDFANRAGTKMPPLGRLEANVCTQRLMEQRIQESLSSTPQRQQRPASYRSSSRRETSVSDNSTASDSPERESQSQSPADRSSVRIANSVTSISAGFGQATPSVDHAARPVHRFHPTPLPRSPKDTPMAPPSHHSRQPSYHSLPPQHSAVQQSYVPHQQPYAPQHSFVPQSHAPPLQRFPQFEEVPLSKRRSAELVVRSDTAYPSMGMGRDVGMGMGMEVSEGNENRLRIDRADRLAYQAGSLRDMAEGRVSGSTHRRRELRDRRGREERGFESQPHQEDLGPYPHVRRSPSPPTVSDYSQSEYSVRREGYPIVSEHHQQMEGERPPFNSMRMSPVP